MISLKKLLYKIMYYEPWKTLPLNTSLFKVHPGDGIDRTPKYKKHGNIVQLNGSVQPLKTLDGTATLYLIGTLPEGYRPYKRVCVLQQSTNQNKYLLSISPDGGVYASRCSSDKAYVAATTSYWFAINVMFFAG